MLSQFQKKKYKLTFKLDSVSHRLNKKLLIKLLINIHSFLYLIYFGFVLIANKIKHFEIVYKKSEKKTT